MAKPIAYYDPSRQLVRVVLLDDVIVHPNADRLDNAIVGGWQCVVGRGVWKKGDKALYCEIGSLLPFEKVPEFMDAARENTKTFGGVNYAYIKTIKLRKEISQGYVCKIPAEFQNKPVDTDLTVALGALKYEANSSGGQVGIYSGSENRTPFQKLIDFIIGDVPDGLLPFPAYAISQTSEDRVQNIAGRLRLDQETEETYEETVKLDGNSCTLLNTLAVKPDGTGYIQNRLCSRTREIPLEPIVVSPWKAFRIWFGSTLNQLRRWFGGATKVRWPKYSRIIKSSEPHFKQVYGQVAAKDLFNIVRRRYYKTGELFSFQGEIIGPGVTAGSRVNYEGVDELAFYCYAVYVNGKKLSPELARHECFYFCLNYVPVVNTHVKLPKTVKEILEMADGKRAFAKDGFREGVVFQSNTQPLSFKAISNKFLLKHDDE